LGDLSQMIDQKSPAQSEIEILKSRLVLGSVIQALHLDLNISSTEDTLRHRLFKNHIIQPNIILNPSSLKIIPSSLKSEIF
jgi:uncharacterized protein involved in exopolysaccharide biosynthesis